MTAVDHELNKGMHIGSAGLSGIVCSPVNIENIWRICVWLCPLKKMGSNSNNYISLDMENDGKQNSMAWSRSYQQCLLFQRQPVGKISHRQTYIH
jgi:hypothetical protein